MTAHEILEAVKAAMQAAEELGSPEGDEYVDLMHKIEAEAKRRREIYIRAHASGLTNPANADGSAGIRAHERVSNGK